MANYCWSKITAFATNSEWKEISTAFSNDRIDWSIGTEGPDCDDWNKEISCENKWSPTPWSEGKMVALSESYPSVQFYYHATYEGGERPNSAWFCNGDETNKKGAESSRKQAYIDEVQRFVSATQRVAEGIVHRVEIMPNGRVAADGENRFGECNIFLWTDIKQISCGNWHTVGLRKDGTVVACGSNANGQCEVNNLPEKAVSVSCGRYHTAILLASGRVIVKGHLEQETPILNLDGKPAQAKSESTNKRRNSIGIYTQTSIDSWPSVVKIKSIFDAVIGATASGEVFVDGFCPCSESEIREYIKDI